MPPGVYRSPEQLLADLGITQPEDIDVEVIAYACGATIVYEPLTGCEAHVMGHDDTAIITVNSSSSRPRQRFSAAHELGHWMRDRGTIAFSCDQRRIRYDSDAVAWRDNPETLANRYAADLLLPDSIFAPLAKGQAVTFATVDRLASRFRTSLMATCIRLVRYGSLPSVVIWRPASGKGWTIADPDVPLQVLKLREEPGDSLARRLLEGGSTRVEGARVYADAWFEHERADRFSVHEDSRMILGGVLTLLWWDDESQLLELESEQYE